MPATDLRAHEDEAKHVHRSDQAVQNEAVPTLVGLAQQGVDGVADEQRVQHIAQVADGISIVLLGLAGIVVSCKTSRWANSSLLKLTICSAPVLIILHTRCLPHKSRLNLQLYISQVLKVSLSLHITWQEATRPAGYPWLHDDAKNISGPASHAT